MALFYSQTRCHVINRKKVLLDRQYYIKVNDYKSPTYKSAVGIPQGSVISPVLCYVYTGDGTVEVKGLHVELQMMLQL